jgi:hypothetical protein
MRITPSSNTKYNGQVSGKKPKHDAVKKNDNPKTNTNEKHIPQESEYKKLHNAQNIQPPLTFEPQPNFYQPMNVFPFGQPQP